MKYVLILLFSIIIFPVCATASTGNGACSYHGGVNCSAGAYSDGSVICNDTWPDSSVMYKDVSECSGYCPSGYTDEYTKTLSDCLLASSQKKTSLMQQRNALINARFNGIYEPTSEQVAYLTITQLDAIRTKNFTTIEIFLTDISTQMQTNETSCDTIKSLASAYCKDFLNTITESQVQTLTSDQRCKNLYGQYSYASAGYCYCTSGFTFGTNDQCTAIIMENKSSVADMAGTDFISLQILKLATTDTSLVNKLKGKILLQVQTYGAAWYLHPITLKRYYLQDGATAYEMLRAFGLGVSEADYTKIETGNLTLKAKLKGQIILRAQAHGEAYYINPKDLSVTYLKDGEAAYQAMRNLSLGISDTDIAKIPIERFVPVK